jgi:hypothetical protein
MKPWILLRIAAVATLLYCAGHTIGMPWTPATGAQEAAVIDAMKSVRFDVMGSSRTYWDFYFGFGLAISGYLAVQAVVLWQLGALARDDADRIRPMIAAFGLAFLVNTIIVWAFFFVVPLILAIVITVCLALAYVFAPPGRAA